MKGIVAILAVGVLIVAGLSLIETEVPNVNDPNGSVGYTQAVATVTASGVIGKTTTVPAGMTLELSAPVTINPEAVPVRKSLLDQLLHPGDLLPIKGSPSPAPTCTELNPCTPPPGCQTRVDLVSVSFTTYAVLEVRDSTGSTDQQKTDPTSWTVEVQRQGNYCDGTAPSEYTYTWKDTPTQEYQFGTYYFHAYGTYSLTATLHAIDANGGDTTITSGKTTADVHPTT